jgi:tetratricopeptide (TPR) repeat protein
MLLVLVLATGPVFAEPASTSRDTRRVRTSLRRGEEELDKAARAKSTARRLRALERARHAFRRARTRADKARNPQALDLAVEARAGLALAWKQEAVVHYGRKSLKRAQKCVEAALKINPIDPEALTLAAAIQKAEDTDIYEEIEGTQARERICRRRAATGAPLRPRGR